MCHHCQRNDNGRVVECTTCNRKRYCEPCMTRWYPKMTKEDFARECPVCQFNCNCKSCLRLEDWSKIYFDGDIQVYGNVDELFELPNGHLYGVCEWHHSPQYKIGYCQQCPDRVKWPAEMGPPPSSYFNAGMFVFEPSPATYDDLMNTIKVTPPSSFAEQDLLNLYFRSIFKPIPLVYNLLLPMVWTHPDKVKVVHFCANVLFSTMVAMKVGEDIAGEADEDYRNRRFRPDVAS